MKAIQIISQDLFDKVRSRFTNLEMGDETGAVTIDPANARFFDFDFVAEGNNLGRVSISLNDLGSLKVYYSQGITENQDAPAKKHWYSFLKEMRFFAMRRLLRFDTRDIAKTNLDKNDFQHLATTQGPKEEPDMTQMNETKKIKKRVSENNGRELTNTPRDQMISRMSPSVDNNALMQKVGKVVHSPEFNSDTILKIVDSPNITHPVGRYIQKEFDELQYDLGREYEDHPEEVAEKLLSMLKDRTQQGLQEGRWNNKSTKKTSRAVKGRTEVIVRHNAAVDEMYPGARSQKKNIKAIFIQNADGERFKYPFIHPAGAFAMAQHVDHGGVPHDAAGKAIITMSEQIAQLQEFQRKIHSSTLHDDATGITERAIGRLQELKSRVDALGKCHHYEAWVAEMTGQPTAGDDIMELDAVTMEQYKQAFTQTSFQEELSGYFPLLHRIMSETNKVDLEDYVSEADEETCNECGMYESKCECDDEVKESVFDAFENWAEAIEQGKLADDQIEELKQAIADTAELKLGPDGQTAWQFFSNFGLNDPDLEDKFKAAADVDPETDPMEVFKLWADENYPELTVALGMSGEMEPPAGAEAPPVEPGAEQPTAENEEDKGMEPVMSREGVIKEVAKIVKSFYNADNPEVGPFRGGEGIALDCKKQIAEKFGDKAGAFAEEMAGKFIDKLTQEWHQKHGRVANGHGDDGLARLKELLGNVKQKVESMGGDTGVPPSNIMAGEEKNPQHSHQYDTTMKHADNPTVQQRMAAHDIKPGIKGYRDRIDLLKDLERTGKLKSEDSAFEAIMRLANYKK
jgi:hypothetical protein